MKTTLTILLYLLFSSILFAQDLNISSSNNNKYTFTVTNQPILSNVNSYWHYYYEFGDGSYLKTSKPNGIEYGYEATGGKNIYFKGVKVYDEGTKPPIQRQNISNADVFTSPDPSFKFPKNEILDNENFRLDINNPTIDVVPNEENVIIMNFKNQTATNWSGQLLLLYNKFENRKEDQERVPVFQTNPNHFVSYSKPNIPVTRFGNHQSTGSGNTRFISAVNNISSLTNQFNNYFAFNFNNVARDEQQNIFINLKSTNQLNNLIGNEIPIAGILKDTNGNVEVRYLNLIVGKAHDPNDITVDPNCISCKNLNNKRLYYTVRFQNDGNGKAKNIVVKVKIPDGVDGNSLDNFSLDFSHFLNNPNTNQPYAIYPKCPNAASTNCYTIQSIGSVITFTFKDANLSGFKEADTQYYDETTGSFRYSLKLNNSLTCNKPLSSYASIIFDNEEPVKTNSAITSFEKAIEFKPNGFKVGADYLIDEKQFGGFVGVSASPNSCKKEWYNQFELLLGYAPYTCNNQMMDSCRLYTINSTDSIKTGINEVKTHNFNLGFVPMHLRKDLTGNFSFGIGLELRLTYKKGEFYSLEKGLFNEQYFGYDSSLFVDANFGFISAGPSIGLRYLYGFEANFSNNMINTGFTNTNRAQAYLQWNF